MLPVIVAVRMSSLRLPGKAMRVIAGRPMLQHVVENVTGVDGTGPVVVATSTAPDDDVVAAWCAAHGVRCHRGPLDDVSSRLVEAAQELGAGAFIRISGDSPLMDPALVAQAANLFVAADVDLVTNVYPRTFPKGCSVEAIRCRALTELLARFARNDDREHVTSAFYRHPEQVRIVNFTSGADVGNVQLSVDTLEDLHTIERIVTLLAGASKHVGWRRLVELAAPGAARLPAGTR